MNICAWCGLPLPAGPAGIERDHIIPRTRGGPDASWNRQPLHKACNRQKGDKLTPEAGLLAQRYGVRLKVPARERRKVHDPEAFDLVVGLAADVGINILNPGPDDIRQFGLFTRCARDMVNFHLYALNQLQKPRTGLNALADFMGLTKQAIYQRIQHGKAVAATLPQTDIDEFVRAISR